MNRKLVTLAVAGALAAPLLAEAQSTVQIYGRLHTEYAFTKQGGRSEDSMGAGGGSNIGFRGTERVSGGLNAWFQCETGWGNTTPGGTSMCDRNSGLGLQGGFGNVLIGNWDLPMKWVSISGVKHEDTGLFGVAQLIHAGTPTTVGNGNAVSTGAGAIATTGAGPTAGGSIVGGQSIATFYRRQANVVQYWTPNMGGFEARFAFTAANEEANSANAAQNGRTPRTWSAGLKYANGPLLLGAGYERHQDYMLSGRDDTGWNVVASYTIGGGHRVGFMYEKHDYESLSATADAEHSAWGIFGNIALGGPHSVQLQYVQARDTKGSLGNGTTGGAVATMLSGSATVGSNLVFNGGAGGTGAKQYGVQYTYAFSKRTNVRLRYSIIDNETNALYALWTPASQAPTAGSRPRGYGFAFDHRF